VASGVETLIRDTVTKGITKIADFNRNRRKSDKPNPYLLGIHEPLAAEHTLTDLSVTGVIPAELDGRYVRIGPNPITPPNPGLYHWFMGDGMIHGVRINGGRAIWYRNRWIRSHAVSEELGEPSAPGPHVPPFDIVNTNILGHAGETWALVEAGGCPVRIDEELNTIAYDTFSETLKGGSFSAHPHLDPLTGELHAICYAAENLTEIRHVVVDRHGKVRREEPVAVQDGPSIHDCMITGKYAIILDMPVTFSLKAYVTGDGFPYKWNPKHKPRVGLLPREGKGTDTIWCDIPPCYVFHPCNAYDNPDGTVTFDGCVHDKVFATKTAGVDSTAIPFERWRIDPAARQVTRTVIDPDMQEFPRMNEVRTGQSYRYAYTLGTPREDAPSSSGEARLFKHDLEAGTRPVHDFGPGKVASEFAFVPASNAASEDHGWLMGYVIDPEEGTSGLVILDARNVEGPAQAVVHIPHRIPPGFHGNWIPA
jgi:8'-apo-carotenoid 13,14-cleaving dioxygenase